MSQSRHSTELVVRADTAQAEAGVDRLNAKMRETQALAARAAGGAPGAGGPLGGRPALPPGVYADTSGRLRTSDGRFYGGGAPGAPGAHPAQPPGIPPPLSPPRGPWADGGFGGAHPPNLRRPGEIDLSAGGTDFSLRSQAGARMEAEARAARAAALVSRRAELGAFSPVGTGIPGGVAGALAYSPSGFYSGMGSLMSSAANRAGQGLHALAGQGTGAGFRVLGAAARAVPFLGAAGSAYFGLLSSSMGRRMGLVGQAAGLERSEFLINQFGGSVPAGFMEQAAGLGISPQQAYSALLSVRRQMGAAHLDPAGLGAATLQAEASGLGAQSLAQWMGMARPGGGARGDVLGAFNSARGAALGLGLTGAGEASYLSRLGSIVGGRAEAGLSTNVGRLNTFAYGAGLVGRGAAAGEGGARTAAGMARIGQGALSQFTSGFGGLAQAALLAEATKGGGSPFEIAQRLAQISGDPYKVRAAISGAFGGEAGKLALLGAGLSPDQALSAMRARSDGSGPAPAITAAEFAQRAPVAAAQTQREMETLKQVIADPAWSKRLIELQTRMDVSLLKLTGRGGAAEKAVDLLEGVLNGIGSLERAIQGLINKMGL